MRKLLTLLTLVTIGLVGVGCAPVFVPPHHGHVRVYGAGYYAPPRVVVRTPPPPVIVLPPPPRVRIGW
jgi:hypothetical protein